MNRLRRPWAPSRRDTNGVQLETLNENGKSKEQADEGIAEKTGIQERIQPVDVEHGHLQELEVDMGHALEDSKIEGVNSDTSPYPEVRAVVPETDDPDMPVNTLRMWVLGTIWTLVRWNNFLSVLRAGRIADLSARSAQESINSSRCGTLLCTLSPSLQSSWCFQWALRLHTSCQSVLSSCLTSAHGESIPTITLTSRNMW